MKMGCPSQYVVLGGQWFIKLFMYYVYTLYSQIQDKFYIGFTNNLKRRIFEHRGNKIHTTQRMQNPKIVYYEACFSKRDAQKREKQLKTGFGRGYLRRRLKHFLMRV